MLHVSIRRSFVPALAFLVAVAFIATSGQVLQADSISEETIYSETFPGTAGSNIAGITWRGYKSSGVRASNGTSGSTAISGSASYPTEASFPAVNSGTSDTQGYLIVGRVTNDYRYDPPTSNYLFYTDEYTISSDDWTLSTIGWYQNHDGTNNSTVNRVAVRTAGQWFVSNDVITNGSSWEWVEIDIPGTTWYELNFTASSTDAAADGILQIDTNATRDNLPISDITGFGFYIDERIAEDDGLLRYDSFTVTAQSANVPEPNTLLLLLTAMIALGLFRRKK